MAQPITDLYNRFDYHRPDEVKARLHEQARGACKTAADAINDLVPDGREKSLAITHLEEAMFWSNAGIARS